MSRNMNQLMKQAQQMQSKISVLQKELDVREMEVSSGGGMIKIKINGKQQILEISINKECVDPTLPAWKHQLDQHIPYFGNFHK